MFVVSRHVDDAITICLGDDEVVITVYEVEGERIKLGIEAPRCISIHREEIYEPTQADKS